MKTLTRPLLIIGCFAVHLFLHACKHKLEVHPFDPIANSNYPPAVAEIFVKKCATSGCHNEASADGSGGLSMNTWQHLFEGGSTGALVVPFSVQYSPLMYRLNTDPALGPVPDPGSQMPKDMPPLTAEEYNIIKDWIAAGAPDKNGNIPFTSDADTRQKIYVTQSTDHLAVIDAASGLVMRYIPIGKLPGSEIPHCVRVSDDGRFAFVSFYGGGYVQKIDTRTDAVVDEIQMPGSSWNIITPSPDGSTAMVSSNDGRIVKINWLTKKTDIIPNLSSPHGITAQYPGSDNFYITLQYGNAMRKMCDTFPFAYNEFSIDGKPVSTSTSATSLDPHEVIMSPNYSKYFITCQKSNQLAVMDTNQDKKITMIPVGALPQEMAVSRKYPYLFISCMTDPSPYSTAEICFQGSVYVFNYNTLAFVKKIEGRFMVAHGLAVDDKNGRLYIFSANSAKETGNCGFPPHHPTPGSIERNGYYNIYDLATLEPASSIRHEVLPTPYSADVRFKY